MTLPSDKSSLLINTLSNAAQRYNTSEENNQELQLASSILEDVYFIVLLNHGRILEICQNRL